MLSLSKDENEDSRLLLLDLIINGKGVLSPVVMGSFDNFMDVYETLALCYIYAPTNAIILEKMDHFRIVNIKVHIDNQPEGLTIHHTYG